jgi:hypothetical protein
MAKSSAQNLNLFVRTLILNQIEQGIFLEMGRSRIGGQPPGKSDVHRPGE